MPEVINEKTLIQVLGIVSQFSTQIVCVIFLFHLCVFFVLWLWWRQHLRVLVQTLRDFTSKLQNQSRPDAWCHPTEQIDAFLADVKDVMAGPKDSEDRKQLQTRLKLFDEKRRYLSAVGFDTSYNICRTMIEAYPLFGILGTLLAMAVGLASRQAGDGGGNVTMIVSRLGEAIWCTVVGLVSTLILMFINSIIEPRFQKLQENRAAIRDAVQHVKRELSTSGGSA